MVFQVIGQILRHALSQGRDDDALIFGDTVFDFMHQIINLAFTWSNFDFWIKQTGRANYLLGWLRGDF